MGVRPFYKQFKHNGVNGPNMATVYSDHGQGVRAPVVFYNRANEAAAQLKPGDFDWKAIFSGGLRWFHSGGIFAALSETTGELIIEGMQAAKAAGAIVSFDLNYRAKLWNIWGGPERAQSVIRRIVENVDVLVGNEEDLQMGLGIPGPEVAARPAQSGGAGSKLDPSAFIGMIDKMVKKTPRRQNRRDHLAGGTFHQPAQVGRGRLDRWKNVYFTDLRTRYPRSCRRWGRVCLRFLFRFIIWRGAARGCESGLGPRRTADYVPGDTTMATLEQV